MSRDDLEEQTTVISNSIKDILEFTFDRDMKMKCFKVLQVDNTYDFSKGFKNALFETVSRHYCNYQNSRRISASQEVSKISVAQDVGRTSTLQRPLWNEHREKSADDSASYSSFASSEHSSGSSTANTQESQQTQSICDFGPVAATSDEHFLSDDQIMEDFLRDIQMLENK